MRHVIQPGLALIGGLAVSTSLFAEVSANVALTTDYIFRGISQSDEHPAIQGGFDYTHDAGVFAGVWGSTVDFDDGGQASMELDYYVGYGGEYKGLEYELSYTYYDYPGASRVHYDYQELGAKLSYQWLSGGLTFSDDYFAESGSYYYPWAGVDLELPQDFALGVRAGYNSIDDNDRFGTDDYLDWSVSITKSYLELDWGLSYVDTDLSKEDCFGGTDLCEGRLVLTVGKAL